MIERSFQRIGTVALGGALVLLVWGFFCWPCPGLGAAMPCCAQHDGGAPACTGEAPAAPVDVAVGPPPAPAFGTYSPPSPIAPLPAVLAWAALPHSPAPGTHPGAEIVLLHQALLR